MSNAREVIDMAVAGLDLKEAIEVALLERGAARPERNRGRKGRPDPKKSRAAEKSYRENKTKIQSSMKKFNRSPRGKMFHKKLGKLRTRMAASIPSLPSGLRDNVAEMLSVFRWEDIPMEVRPVIGLLDAVKEDLNEGFGAIAHEYYWRHYLQPIFDDLGVYGE